MVFWKTKLTKYYEKVLYKQWGKGCMTEKIPHKKFDAKQRGSE